MLSNRVIDFLKQSDDDCLSQLLFGVEWEVSDAGRLNGAPEVDEDSDEVYDWLLGRESESAYAAQLIGLQYHGRCPLVISDRDELETFIDSYTRYSFSELISDALTSYQENNEGSGLPEAISGWEVQEESTRGIIGEFVTDECCTFEEQLNRCENLLTQAGRGFTSPTNGSFHIHINIPGCEHKLGNDSKLHCCILWELSQLVGDFPECFWRRLRAAEEYFRLDSSPGAKFSAVHSHSQGTLEFRLFGHIEDLEDAEQCLRIAGLAFIRGYRRYAEARYKFHNTKIFRVRFSEAVKSKSPMAESDIDVPHDIPTIMQSEGYNFQESEDVPSSAPYSISCAMLQWVYQSSHPYTTIGSQHYSANPGFCFSRTAYELLPNAEFSSTQLEVLKSIDSILA